MLRCHVLRAQAECRGRAEWSGTSTLFPAPSTLVPWPLEPTAALPYGIRLPLLDCTSLWGSGANPLVTRNKPNAKKGQPFSVLLGARVCLETMQPVKSQLGGGKEALG